MNFLRTLPLAILAASTPLFGMQQPEKKKAPFDTTYGPLIVIARLLADTHKKNPTNRIPIVAIGGSTGVGKSTFAKEFLQCLLTLDVSATLVKLDSFNQPEEVPAEERPPHFESQKHFNHNRAHHVLAALRNCHISGRKIVTIPQWDHTVSPSRKYDKPINFQGVDLIITEGLYALTSASSYNLLPYSDARIFIAAPPVAIREWLEDREAAKPQEHQRDPARLKDDLHWDMVDYARVVAPTRVHADFVVEKDYDHTYKELISQNPPS